MAIVILCGLLSSTAYEERSMAAHIGIDDLTLEAVWCPFVNPPSMEYYRWKKCALEEQSGSSE